MLSSFWAIDGQHRAQLPADLDNDKLISWAVQHRLKRRLTLAQSGGKNLSDYWRWSQHSLLSDAIERNRGLNISSLCFQSWAEPKKWMAAIPIPYFLLFLCTFGSLGSTAFSWQPFITNFIWAYKLKRIIFSWARSSLNNFGLGN